MLERLKVELSRLGWDSSLYIDIYNKCSTVQRLTADEYKIGIDLSEIGFMKVSFTPIWNGDNYRGKDVEFLSVKSSKQ